MRAEDFGDLSALLGDARLTGYLARYGGKPDEALRLYTWNAAASAALWGPLGVVEVAVRNSIHSTMRERTQEEFWWNSPRVHLMDRELGLFDEAIDKLKRDGKESPSADDIVAATSFGLWVGLTSAGIPKDPLFSYQHLLWDTRIHRAFSKHDASKRRELNGNLNDLRKIRNRIAHHEPIWNRQVPHVMEQVLAVAGAVSADVARYIEQCERVTEIEALREAYVVRGENCRF